MADDHKASVEEIDLQKEAIGEVHGVEANPAAAALAAATAAQKPRMFSRGMIRLWLIVSRPTHLVQRYHANAHAGRYWLPCLNDERFRQLIDGQRQRDDPVPKDVRPFRCRLEHWCHLHHL